MLATRGRRLVRRQWLGLPIGMYLHLVLDLSWTRSETFWWPFLGVGIEWGRRLRAGPRTVVAWSWSVVAIVVGVWAYRRFGLDDAGRRRTLPAHRSARPRADGRGSGAFVSAAHADAFAAVGASRSDRRRTRRACCSVVPTRTWTSSAVVRPRRWAHAIASGASVPWPRWCRARCVARCRPPRRSGCPVVDRRSTDRAGLRRAGGHAGGRGARRRPGPRGSPTSTSARRAASRWRTLGARVRAACSDWASSIDAPGTVVLVSHVSPVKAAVAWALGVGDQIAWRAHLDNASVTQVADARAIARC